MSSDISAILAKLSPEDRAKLEAKLATAQASKSTTDTPEKLGSSGLTAKLTQKGGVAVYGLQRFPVTLYGNAWLRLLQVASELAAYIARHSDRVSFEKPKEDSKAESKPQVPVANSAAKPNGKVVPQQVAQR